ncbi:MAG: LysR family transcriptional regulator [Bdellovibrionales bacterium]|nr:LysR family transcriptional regulator [Bdellovibrionales bacterium]
MIYQHVYKLWLLKILNHYGNFKETANHARMTQSAVSQNLTALEKEMKTSLVIRERGEVKLTQEGEGLLKKVLPVLDILKDIEDQQGQGGQLTGRVRIGAYESLAVQLAHYLYGTLEIKQPDLKVELVTARTHNLLDMIRKGQIDMAFVINGKEESRIKNEVIASEGLGLYTSKDNPVIDALQKNENVVLKMATLAPSVQDGYPLFYKRFLKNIPFDSKVALRSDSFETLRTVAGQTNLVSILPHRVARLAKEPLYRIWPEESDSQREHSISFVWRENMDSNIISLLSNVAKRVL